MGSWLERTNRAKEPHSQRRGTGNQHLIPATNMLPQTRAVRWNHFKEQTYSDFTQRLQASNVATSVRPDNAMHNVTQWQCRSGQKAIGENNENPPQPNHHTSCDGYEVSDILSTHPLPTSAQPLPFQLAACAYYGQSGFGRTTVPQHPPQRVARTSPLCHLSRFFQP